MLVAGGFLLQPPQDPLHGGLTGLRGRAAVDGHAGGTGVLLCLGAEVSGSQHPLTDAHPPAAIKTMIQCWRPAYDVTPGGGSER